MNSEKLDCKCNPENMTRGAETCCKDEDSGITKDLLADSARVFL